MTVSAGATIIAADVNLAGLKAVRRGNRTSTTGNIVGTETGVLRVDSIPITNGRLYMAMITSMGINSSGSTDSAIIRLRGNTSGTATTSSAEFGVLRDPRAIPSGSSDPLTSFSAFYFAATTGNLSVLLTAQRIGSTDNITISGGTGGLNLVFLDCGEDPGDTGVDI